MSSPRFFLVAPRADDLFLCATAACAAGDCASILVSDKTTQETIVALQSLGLAVIIQDCEPRLVHHLKADGMHLSRSEPVKNLRGTLKNEVIGVFAATSRHIAMEAAESGADYIAFAQGSQVDGEPLLGWWQSIFEVPTVAFDPVGLSDLASVLPQNPDFIRPFDSMWDSPRMASEMISAMQAQMK